MDPGPGFIGAVKTSHHLGVRSGHMVAVVGERFARGEAGNLPHDFVALDHLTLAIRLFHHPLAPSQFDRAVGTVFDGDEINKRVRFVPGQTRPTSMINETVEASLQAGKFRGNCHNPNRSRRRRVATVELENSGTLGSLPDTELASYFPGPP